MRTTEMDIEQIKEDNPLGTWNAEHNTLTKVMRVGKREWEELAKTINKQVYSLPGDSEFFGVVDDIGKIYRDEALRLAEQEAFKLTKIYKFLTEQTGLEWSYIQGGGLAVHPYAERDYKVVIYNVRSCKGLTGLGGRFLNFYGKLTGINMNMSPQEFVDLIAAKRWL